MTVVDREAPVATSRLSASTLRLSYGKDSVVIDGLDLDVPCGRVTALVGANGSGKSTLLRALAGLHHPDAGAVLLDGHEVRRLRPRELARRLGLLPQSPTTPEGITVRDLVRRGRTPHTSMWRQWSDADEQAVTRALEATGMTLLADHPADALSGGQRQRAWIALAVAQDTPLLLLDEPTTYLDLAHQLDVLGLVRRLNADHGRTVVMVLHDLAQACRYADHLVALKGGRVVTEGTPAEVVTEDVVREVFDVECRVVPDPVTGTPLVVPVGRAHRTSRS